MNGKIIGFNIDPNFSNCLDGLMLVDISDIPFAMLDNLAKEMEDSQVKERFKPVLIMHSIVQENVCQC